MSKNKSPELQPHPAAETFRTMTEEEFGAFKEDIRKNSQREPIVLLDGKILDGRNRYRACRELGFEPRAISASSVNIGDPLSYVLSANLHRRHLSAEEKRDVLKTVLKADPKQSDRQAAKKVGVDHKTVGSVRSEMEGRGEIPHVEARVDAFGRRQPVRKKCSKARGSSLAGRPAKLKLHKAGPVEVDALGAPVPEHLRDVFADRLLRDRVEMFNAATTQIKSAASWNPFLELAEVTAGLERTITALEDAIPHAVHGKCGGNGCDVCRGKGWLPKWRHEELQAQEG
jgi:hypothetical protein